MKKFLFCIAAIATLLTACQSEEEFGGMKSQDTFSAKFEQTRVYLGNDYYARWEAGDKVSVFTQNDLNRVYSATTGNVKQTTLSFVQTPAGEANALPDFNYAIFPYNEANSVAGGVLSSVLSANQEYNPEHPSLNNAVMVSKIPTGENIFTFMNACALVKVNIKVNPNFADVKVKNISITSQANNLAGNVTVDMNGEDFAAKVATENASKTVTLTGCDKAGTLSNEEYTTFFLTIPAGTYAVGDLVIKIETEDGNLDYTTSTYKEYTIGRSEYVEFKTTLGGNVDWGYIEQNKITINKDAHISKALMTDVTNVLRAGFTGQDKVETYYPIPYDQDFVIDGGEKTLTFKFTPTEEGIFIMNTFTSYFSGRKDIAFEDVPKLTVNNLNITGELRSTFMGTYVGAVEPTSGGTADQTKFNTEWNNVKVNNCKIIPSNAQWGGAAVATFGTAVLNNCEITGTKQSSQTSENLKDLPLYDLYNTNNTTIIINGGKVGHMFCTEHSNVTINEGAVIEKITTILNGVLAFKTAPNYASGLTINKANIKEINFNTPYGNNGGPKVFIGAETVIETLTIAKPGNYKNFTIEEGAQIENIVLTETVTEGETTTTVQNTYTLDQFKALIAASK